MKKTKIAIVKIGSKSIADETGAIRTKLLDHLVMDVKAAHFEGWSVAIVSSGAVVCGKKDPGMIGVETTDQVFSMVGQRHLLNHWAEAFGREGITTGQGLYTNRMLISIPERKRSIREGLLESFARGIVPILNENDAAVLDELKELMNEGDNDHFGSLIGCLLNASILVLLTTVEGLLDPSGQLVPRIDARNKEIVSTIGTWPGQSNGGMASKVQWGQHFVSTTLGQAFIKRYDDPLPLSRAIRGIRSGSIIELD